MDNIFRGQILKEVKFVSETGEWVVNGAIIMKEGLSEIEKMTLEGFSGENWKLLKSEAKIKGNVIC